MTTIEMTRKIMKKIREDNNPVPCETMIVPIAMSLAMLADTAVEIAVTLKKIERKLK